MGKHPIKEYPYLSSKTQLIKHLMLLKNFKYNNNAKGSWLGDEITYKKVPLCCVYVHFKKFDSEDITLNLFQSKISPIFVKLKYKVMVVYLL